MHGTPVTMRVERLVHRGMGLGRVEGRIWMVPLTAPGDRIEAVAHRIHPGHVEGRMVRLIDPGPDRVPAPCPWYGTCGGCHLQHIREDRQPVWKAQVLLDVLTRIARVDVPAPIVRTGDAWHWRGRIEVHGEARGGRLVLGFFRRGSKDLVEVRECAIAHPSLGRLLGSIPKFLQDLPVRGSVTLELVRGEPDRVAVVIRGDLGPPERTAGRLFALPSVTGVLIRDPGGWHLFGDSLIRLVTDDGSGGRTEVTTDPRGFSQAHLALNPFLAARVRELAGAGPGTRVTEIHAGSGNLTVPLALAGAEVTALEINENAVRLGRDQTTARGLRVHWVPLEAEALLRRPDLLAGREVLVMDPPRTGLGLALARFLAARPLERIVWFSCDPAPLARDLGPFLRAGFVLDTIEMWDLFPQTFHLETLVRLRRAL